jgi:hypothetical protein
MEREEKFIARLQQPEQPAIAKIRFREHVPTATNTRATIKQKQKQKLTAGNQPARSLLASGPAGTHGHIFFQCQELCFFSFR